MTAKITCRDSRVWQNAHTFVMEVHAVTKNFPGEGLSGLISQFHPTAKFPLKAIGSQLFLAQELQYPVTVNVQVIASDIHRLLAAFIKPIRP